MRWLIEYLQLILSSFFVVRHLLGRDKNTQSSVSILKCLVSDITEEGKKDITTIQFSTKYVEQTKKKNQQNISDSSLRKYPVLEMEHAVTTKNL